MRSVTAARPGILKGLVGFLLAVGFTFACREDSARSIEAVKSEQTHAALTAAIHAGVEATREARIDYLDFLGEGDGAWDPDPRWLDPDSDKAAYNCMTWWQSVVAEAFARANPVPYRPDRLRQKLLDLFRYYEGVPSFSNRKHFLDVAMEREPGPFRRLDLHSCGGRGVRPRPFAPDFEGWKKSIGYGCELTEEIWAEGRAPSAMVVDAISPGKLENCLEELEPGRFYFVLPIAAESYLKRYGTRTGRMAQVHAWLVRRVPFSENVRRHHPANKPPLPAYRLEAHHASFVQGRVRSFTLWPGAVHDIESFDGFVLYEIDSAWDWRGAIARSEERIAAGEGVGKCEQGLARTGKGRSLFVALPKKKKRGVGR